jgi:serine/threonine protein kinase/tetratricopeptide (TPR) repeat protein
MPISINSAERERFRQIEEVFCAAIERPMGEERDILVRDLCGADENLRIEVTLLLEDHERIRATVPEAGTGDGHAVALPEPGRRFGPYRTERLLGCGGMGAVYLARRADGQFDQIVALKVMASHLAGEEFVRGFRNERQLLAALAHPHITRLLDGGVAENGELYLVMEYIEGQPLDRYCADRKLPVEARIRLFLQVCEAVEFAHRNLIIHGDLKPANILVTADGTVKLLDFGTAKLSHDPDGKVTRFAVLTPRYASPEQLRGELVNTLSDEFSLGVILYEMLTGARPFGDPKSTADAVERILHGRGPGPPAQAVSEGAAAERSASRDRLRRQIEGDLSTIVLKMLESEPAHRYASVREVKEDLERLRQGRPVHARPHSALYAAHKFAVRNWLGVSATGLAVAALTTLTIVSVYESAQAREQAALARAQALRAERVSEFVKATFISASSFWASPLRGKRDAIQFSDILDNASERVGKELANDPAAEADLRDTLGFTYALLGEPAKGEMQLLLGIQMLPRIRGGSPKIALSLYAHLCDTRNFQGRYADALAACREAVAIWRVSDPVSLGGGVLHDTAFMAVNAGEPLPDAEEIYREALRFPRPNDPLYSSTMNTRIGLLRLRQGDLAHGERLLREAEPALRGKGEPFTEVVPVLYARAFAEDVRGHYPEAVRLMSEALDLVTRRRVSFMEPDELALQLAAYEALAGNREALARLRGVEGRLPSVAAVDRIRHGLFTGIVEAHCGSKVAAEQHLRSALATQEKEMSRQPDLSVEIWVRLMELLRGEGREKEAAEAARQGLRAAALAYGNYFAGHPFVIEMQKNLQ